MGNHHSRSTKAKKLSEPTNIKEPIENVTKPVKAKKPNRGTYFNSRPSGSAHKSTPKCDGDDAQPYIHVSQDVTNHHTPPLSDDCHRNHHHVPSYDNHHTSHHCSDGGGHTSHDSGGHTSHDCGGGHDSGGGGGFSSDNNW